MSILKRMGGVLLGTLLLLGLTLGSFGAKEPYTYRVTFHAGAQGSFVQDAVSVRGKSYSIQRTEDAITISGLRQGDRVTWDNDAVALTQGSRYYIRGVRLSGRDNSTVDATSFTVQGDSDYVVAYGISGNTVAYRVRYQDESGRELHKSRTLHGNVGDKPVVAAVYIEGYLPQAWNLTGTLKADESKNVFTFVYRAVETSNNGNPGDNGDNGQGDNGGTGNTQAPADQNTQPDQNPRNQGNGETAADDTPEEPSSEEEVPELIDIDDEETPLARGADTGLENEANRVELLFPAVAVISAAAVIGLTIWWNLTGRKKKNRKSDKNRK